MELLSIEVLDLSIDEANAGSVFLRRIFDLRNIVACTRVYNEGCEWKEERERERENTALTLRADLRITTSPGD